MVRIKVRLTCLRVNTFTHFHLSWRQILLKAPSAQNDLCLCTHCLWEGGVYKGAHLWGVGSVCWGPFTQSSPRARVSQVILRDLLRFLLVYLVFLFGFAVGKDSFTL